MRLRTTIRAAAVAAAIAGGTLAVSAPAQADKSDCTTGRACLWSNAYYNGTGQPDNQFWQWPNAEPDLLENIDDKASSARNNGTRCRADFYTGANYTGDRLTMHLQDFRDNLALDPRGSGTWNDVITSLKWVCPDQ
ncbi:peptidase inhibitor family I36 protein [Symbioplanes lichenis]|uniref:peptidase inhibitor family I36 protein n=1 Tax=Symbioplanes lichenis TaxID=1629072 RepID=UPI0027393ADC|nr:peptidase inhibitor family I36 protein [Actinoplanes lichenis]